MHAFIAVPFLGRSQSNDHRKGLMKGSRKMQAVKEPVVHSDPEIMGGEPVFLGTRVPVKSLFDYLEAGNTVDQFLHSFPTVTREQVIGALEIGREAVEAVQFFSMNRSRSSSHSS